MAQIVVRGIDDEVMRRFKERARKQGKSAEQAVRDLIEAESLRAVQESDWLTESRAFRERMAAKYGISERSAADDVREDRDSR